VEIFGYNREEITTLNEWQQFVCHDPDYRRWAADTWQSSVHRAVEKKTLIEAGEYRLTCKSGETRTFVVSGAILGDNVLAVFFDITERQRAEEALLASQLRLTEAMDLACIIYWEVDPKTGEFIFNDPFYTFYGTTAEREGGYRMSREEYGKRFVHPDDMYIFQQAAETRLASKERKFQNDVEHRIVRGDGEVRHIFARIHVSRDATGRITRYYGANQDITERKKQEEERAKLWSAVERVGEGVFMLTPDGSCYSYVNAAFCKAYGFTHEELAGKSTAVTRSDRHPQPFHDSIWSDLQVGKTWSGRQTRQRKDGALIEVETTIAPVRDASGTIIHYVGVGRDITQQLQLESQLRQAQKMEAIGTLAGGVAHDFNNILTVIMGLANLIQMGVGPDDRLRRHIDQIVLSSERAAELTRSLLAFSRKQQIDVKPHDVNAVVASTAKLLKRLLPEDVELRVNLADHSLVTLLDIAQIDQVLINLATNARDAMPNGGSLTISILSVELEESFRKTHGFGKPGRYVLLSVSDTGIGMDEETMTRIFDPFFTTKEVGKGTGLGLSSVYGIVKQHGGYVDVKSKVLKGTTFDVYLPLVNTAARHATAESVQVKGGSETILVIEDDADVRKMMITVLSDQGYTILEAANGENAIRVFDEHKEATSLVILDVVMPGKNGRKVLDEIARLNPLIRAIFVSGYTGDIVLDKGVQEDGVDFLQKPVSVAKLLSKVREVLDR
jgi:PAS domain S-box-containing protein